MIDDGIEREARPGRMVETSIVRYDGSKVSRTFDNVATEEPLELRLVAGATMHTLAVTMRTPGNDFELAAGFVSSERIVQSGAEIVAVSYCIDPTIDAEQRYNETRRFELVNTGGYYHSLPGDPLRQFIDTVAEVQRAMGFENEKDHPEVAPAQFEINYSYGEVTAAADTIQLYKLICRQVATNLGMTASFLPKPVVGVNGSGMHTNVSVSKGGKNLFWDAKGEERLSSFGWKFIDRILSRGNDTCLVFNASVNAYRRLDPHFEAPNQIKASAVDRGSMVRIPIGNERSARVEVRSVGPDANPYLALLTVFKTGLHGTVSDVKNLRQAERYLPDNIYDALADFRGSDWVSKLIGEDVKTRYADLKQASADRCPRLLGSIVKPEEVQFHHEVYNQYLWNLF